MKSCSNSRSSTQQPWEKNTGPDANLIIHSMAALRENPAKSETFSELHSSNPTKLKGAKGIRRSPKMCQDSIENHLPPPSSSQQKYTQENFTASLSLKIMMANVQWRTVRPQGGNLYYSELYCLLRNSHPAAKSSKNGTANC